ncbi:MAG: MJ0042-type zinc finger domain-containing protein [Alphaproteobacteria bacterium]
MILQCPACNTRYLVPDTSIGATGRTVRCAKCKHTWQVAGVAQPPMSAVSEMVEEINVKPRPIPKGSNLPAVKAAKPSIALMASVLGFTATALTLLLIMLFPSLIGSPPSNAAVISDLAITKQEKEGAPTIYEIKGKIHNTSGEDMVSPVLRVSIVDSTGSSLQYMDFSEEGKVVKAYESFPFTTGEIPVKFTLARKFVVEVGSPLELALRDKPDATTSTEPTQ